MDSHRFDALTRRVGAVDRKSALKMLGGTLVAVAATRPQASGAKKENTCKKKCDRKCGKVEKSCKQHWNEECGANQTCRDNFHACCEHFGKCRGGKYFDCVSNLAM